MLRSLIHMCIGKDIETADLRGDTEKDRSADQLFQYPFLTEVLCLIHETGFEIVKVYNLSGNISFCRGQLRVEKLSITLIDIANTLVNVITTSV